MPKAPRCPKCGRFVGKEFIVNVPAGATVALGNFPLVGPFRIKSCNHCGTKTAKLADSQEVIISMQWVEFDR